MQLLPTRRLALVAAVARRRDAVRTRAARSTSGWRRRWSRCVLVAASGWSTRSIGTSPKVLLLRREHPPVVVAGREATLTWEVRSESSRSLRVGLADDLAPSLRARVRRCLGAHPAAGNRQGHHHAAAAAARALPAGPPDRPDRRPARASAAASAGSRSPPRCGCTHRSAPRRTPS